MEAMQEMPRGYQPMPEVNLRQMPQLNKQALEQVVAGFIDHKLRPFLAAKGLKSSHEYPVARLVQILSGGNREYSSPVIEEYREKGIEKVFGADYAIDWLRIRYMKTNDLPGLAEFFGVCGNDLIATGMIPNAQNDVVSEETRTRLYTLVAERASTQKFRLKVHRLEEACHVSVGGKEYLIPGSVQKQYLKEFGLHEFDGEQLTFIQSEIDGLNGNSTGRMIKTKYLLIRLSKGVIASIKINRRYGGSIHMKTPKKREAVDSDDKFLLDTSVFFE